MKKLWVYGMAALFLLLSVVSTAAAQSSQQAGNRYQYQQMNCEQGITTANQYRYTYQIQEQNTDQPQTKLRGIWGYADDTEPQGYVGGFIVNRGRCKVFKGLWNTTDGSYDGRIIVIGRNGYFNGRVLPTDGEPHRITGLYYYDTTNSTIRLRWMTKNASGWAAGQIIEA
jgi:hypothetical protein